MDIINYAIARKSAEGGGGQSITVEQLNVDQNGTYTPPQGKAYGPVNVDVPQPALETLNVTANGTYSAPSGKAYNEVDVDVPSSGTDPSLFLEEYTENTDLSSYSLGNLTSLRQYAFYSQTRLLNITLPQTLTSIGSYAFYYCSKLPLSSLPSSITKLGAGAFQRCAYLSISELPSSLTTLGKETFSGCTNITISSFPPNLSSIPTSCFSSCNNITSLTFHSGITSIDSSAFNGSINLTFVDLSSAITSVGNAAFAVNWKSGSIVICRAVNPPTLGSNALGTNFSNLTIYVPDDSVDTYKAAKKWSVYADKMQPLSNYSE